MAFVLTKGRLAAPEPVFGCALSARLRQDVVFNGLVASFADIDDTQAYFFVHNFPVGVLVVDGCVASEITKALVVPPLVH